MSLEVRSKLNVRNTETEVLLAAKSERVEMTLNTSNALASGLLIQRLTELYENPIEATVRETVSNALDAVVVKHSGERPVVKISVPTMMNPILVIKDNGVGMSYQDLKEIYSKYGASTKAQDLEQIGAYGLGAKSPLAYGTEFTVTSVKENVKTTIIVAREELTNYIKIVGSELTDESSGTTVSIPVNNSDIRKFTEYVEKYNTNPIEKDVDLYINNKLVEANGYVLVSNNTTIYKGSNETVTSRMWIKPANIVDLFLGSSETDIRNSLNLLIGGWVYESPSNRDSSRYKSADRNIIVELKAGIVGFNSSRDSVLSNERSETFEKTVVEYVKSKEFTNILIQSINKLGIDEFKRILVKVFENNKNICSIESGKLKLDKTKLSNPYSRVIAREFDFDDLVHEETGFSMNSFIENMPAKRKSTCVIIESKNRYSKSRKTSILKSVNNEGFAGYSEINLHRLNEILDGFFDYDKPITSLEHFMFNFANEIFNLREESTQLIFVTDIEDEVEMKKMRTKRKAIFNTMNVANSNSSSFLGYTAHTKAEIEKMLKNSGFEDVVNVQIFTYTEMIELLSSIRKKNIELTGSSIKKGELSTSLSKFDKDNGYNYTSVIPEKDDKTLIVMVKDRYSLGGKLPLIANWYCNENNLEIDDLKMYISIGVHSLADIKILEEAGNLYNAGQDCGRSKYYQDTYKTKNVGYNLILNSEIEKDKEAIIRLLAIQFRSTYSALVNELSHIIKNTSELARDLNIEFDGTVADEFIKFLKDHKEIDRNEIQNNYVDNRYNTDRQNHLLSFIDKKHYNLIMNLSSVIYTNNSIEIENGEVKLENYNDQIDIKINSDILSSVMKSSKSEIFKEIIRAKAVFYVNFIKETLEGLSAIKI